MRYFNILLSITDRIDRKSMGMQNNTITSLELIVIYRLVLPIETDTHYSQVQDIPHSGS